MLLVCGSSPKVVDQVAPTDIEHRAGRDNRAESDLFDLAPIENRGQQCAALAQKGDIAGLGRILGEGGVQSDGRIHDPQAIGTNQAHAAATQLFLNLPFQFDALRSPFAKSRRDHYRGFHTRIDAFADDAGNRGRGCCDDRKIYFLGDVANFRIGFAATNFGMTGIDRVHLSLKRRMQQVFENSPSNRARPVGGSDHGDGISQK